MIVVIFLLLIVCFVALENISKTDQPQGTDTHNYKDVADVEHLFPDELNGRSRLTLYNFDIAGVFYADYQRALKVKPGENVILKIIENEHDPEAIAVILPDGTRIGWMPNQGTMHKHDLYMHLSGGNPVFAKVKSKKIWRKYDKERVYMHAASPTRKGHTYRKYFCSAKCGAGSISVIDVDYAATSYLRELLSDKNQKLIADALQQYTKAKTQHLEEYNTAVKKIRQKQEKINALYQNLSSGALPVEVVAEMGNMIKTLKDEVAAISSAEPPVDYTVPQIKQWLKALKESVDQKAIHMLIERIDIKTKIVANVTSTLATVLGKHGCGGRT